MNIYNETNQKNLLIEFYDYTQERYGEDFGAREERAMLISKVMELSQKIATASKNPSSNFMIDDAFHEAMVDYNNQQNGNLDFNEED